MDQKKQKKVIKALLAKKYVNPEIWKLSCKKTIMVHNGKIVGAFESAAEASRKTGIPVSSITKLCRHEAKRPRLEFRFFYEGDSELYKNINK